MTIEEAIEHYKEVAKGSFEAALSYARANAYETAISFKECGQEHEQLAEWLTELKQRREAEITAPSKTEEGKRTRMSRYIDADKYEQELRRIIEIVCETGHVPGISGELSKPLCTAYIVGLRAAITALATYREHEEVKQLKTNGDLIRRMTDEELAERFGFEECKDSRYGYECPGWHAEDCGHATCKKYFLEWLKQEVVE